MIMFFVFIGDGYDYKNRLPQIKKPRYREAFPIIGEIKPSCVTL